MAQPSRSEKQEMFLIVKLSLVLVLWFFQGVYEELCENCEDLFSNYILHLTFKLACKQMVCMQSADTETKRTKKKIKKSSPGWSGETESE